MSTLDLPTSLSRAGRHLLLLALREVYDDTGDVPCEGDPPSAMTTLMRITGHTDRGVRVALKELERHGLVRRRLVIIRGRPGRGALHVRVIVEAAVRIVGGRCEVCSRPAQDTGRWCATCRQTYGRHDRDWQTAARVLLAVGHAPLQIAGMLRRPYRDAGEDDGRRPHGGAVLPYLVHAGLLGPEWRARLNGDE